MDDKDLKIIVDETIQSNDEELSIIVFDVVKKISELPDRYETTISNLTSKDVIHDIDTMFKITTYVHDVCQKINIILDISKYKDLDIGLPFHTPFVIKFMNKTNNYLYREDLINDFDSDKIWSKSLSIDEVIELLNKLENKLSSYDFIEDKNFVNDGRRSELKSYINDRINDNSDDSVLESLFNLWEYINNEYCIPLQVASELKIPAYTVDKMWQEYKKSGIICSQEKNEILEMISYIKESIKK